MGELAGAPAGVGTRESEWVSGCWWVHSRHSESVTELTIS